MSDHAAHTRRRGRRRPRTLPPGAQVIAVCDRAHERVEPSPDRPHRSIPDPVVVASHRAFDEVVARLGARRAALVHGDHLIGGARP